MLPHSAKIQAQEHQDCAKTVSSNPQILNKIKFDKHRTIKAMAYVYHGGDGTIYLWNNLKTWAKYEMTQDPIDVMTSTLSHESLHIVMDRIGECKASLKLDDKFGKGDEHKAEYHGLCKFDKYFKPTPKSRRIKNWR